MPTHVICTSPLANSFTFVTSLSTTYYFVLTSVLSSVSSSYFSLALFNMFLTSQYKVHTARSLISASID